MRSNNQTMGQWKAFRFLVVRVNGLIAGALLICSPVNAATDFGMNLEVGVIRSDNVLLAPDGAELDETIFVVTPEFYFTSDDPRFDADLRYQPQAIFYDELDQFDEVFHILDARLTTSILRDRLFLDVNATNFETISEPEGAIPSGNLSLTGNRTEARVLQAGPYWMQPIGQTNLLVRGTYTDFSYDDDRFQSSNSKDGYFELGNIERQQGFAWQVDYLYRRTEYDVSTPWEFQRAGLNLGAWITDSTRLFVAGGAETAFDNLFESNMDSDFWEAGFQYAPNERFNLEMAAGDRSYGTSLRGDLSYQLRRGQLSANYSEAPSNRSDLLMERRPLAALDDLDGALDRPGAADRFVLKRGEVSLGIELAKSEFDFRLFSEVREARTTADGEILDDEELAGFAARWNWQFGRRTSLGVGGELADRDYSGVKDEFRRLRLDIAYRLSEKLGFRVEVARFDQEGDVNSDRDYTENQYRLFVNANF